MSQADLRLTTQYPPRPCGIPQPIPPLMGRVFEQCCPHAKLVDTIRMIDSPDQTAAMRRIPPTWLRGKSLELPVTAIGTAENQAVVEPAGAALPELDPVGDESVTAPVLGPGNRGLFGVLLLKLTE